MPLVAPFPSGIPLISGPGTGITVRVAQRFWNCGTLAKYLLQVKEMTLQEKLQSILDSGDSKGISLILQTIEAVYERPRGKVLTFRSSAP